MGTQALSLPIPVKEPGPENQVPLPQAVSHIPAPRGAQCPHDIMVPPHPLLLLHDIVEVVPEGMEYGSHGEMLSRAYMYPLSAIIDDRLVKDIGLEELEVIQGFIRLRNPIVFLSHTVKVNKKLNMAYRLVT